MEKASFLLILVSHPYYKTQMQISFLLVELVLFTKNVFFVRNLLVFRDVFRFINRRQWKRLFLSLW